MQHFLPVGKVLLSAFHRVNFAFTLKCSILLLFFMSASDLKAQNEPEYIQGWTGLQEAEFHFDVSYAVVKCSEGADPMVLLNAFNEGGNVSKIGFTLDITDGKGKKAQKTIASFDIAFAEMQIASCDSDKYSNLKFAVPDGIDAATMKIKITYNR